jgi:hypothetical protein
MSFSGANEQWLRQRDRDTTFCREEIEIAKCISMILQFESLIDNKNQRRKPRHAFPPKPLVSTSA